MADTGFDQCQWLIANDGRFVQVTELLYRVAEQADGTKSSEEIAAAVTAQMPYVVTAEHICRLIDTKLEPLGLVTSGDDDARVVPGRPKTGPLQVNGRIATVGPRVLDPITRRLQHLFRPWVAIPALLAIVAAHVWLYLGQGVGAAIIELIQRPVLVVPLFGIVVLAGIFHEFGHAAALRYGGGRSGGMGFGFYLIYPALYTDTSDGYRLGRRARIRTDLGGFYFHQLFALGLLGLWAVTDQPLLALAVMVIDLEMLRQLLFPFVRFDGYWLLADLVGIPDLYTHLGGVLRRRLTGEEGAPALRPWPRRVFAVYTAVTIPVLVGLFVLFVTRAPTFLAAMWGSWQDQLGMAAAALRQGDVVASLLPVLQTLLLALPVAAGIYLVVSLVRMARRIPWSMLLTFLRRRGVPGVTESG